MANPTRFQGWTFPQADDDPWYPGWAALWRKIDDTMTFGVAVASLTAAGVMRVETAALGMTTQVISFYPSSEITFAFSAGLTVATWHVPSAAPYGACVGCFTAMGSADQFYFTLDAAGYQTAVDDETTAAKLLPAPLRLYPRLVICGGPRGALPSTHTLGDSYWQWTSHWHANHDRMHFEGVTSLGPGTYSVELQLRGYVDTQAYVYRMNVRDSVSLTVDQGVCGDA
jgi:hypothetical protein